MAIYTLKQYKEYKMNKERQTEIVYTEKELRTMREDDLFQERYWKDDECFNGSKLKAEKPIEPKPYVYGTDKHMDFVIDELKRLKLEKDKRNERK